MNNPYSDYPKSYIHCFVEACSRKAQCSRYLAAQHLRADDTMGYAVFPTILGAEGGCRYFHRFRTIHGAWGFDRLFENVKYKDASTIRKALKDYLGGNGTYSRYKRGLKLLTPEQQEQIRGLFRRFGYDEGLEFDHYQDVIDW